MQIVSFLKFYTAFVDDKSIDRATAKPEAPAQATGAPQSLSRNLLLEEPGVIAAQTGASNP